MATKSLLKPAGTTAAYFKAGILGFGKSGKTYTAMRFAVGIREYFGLDGPIAFLDTEGGAPYLARTVQKETGRELMVVSSRSFDDLVATAEECIASGVSVLVVDSITHPWRELCAAYLKQINEARLNKGWKPRAKLEFQDWATIKAKWERWTDLYLNAPLHIIICGRAGYEYDFEEDADGKKELRKTGIKMKTETEFGFEPSLLIEMEREQVPIQGETDKWRLARKATVIGDRFAVLDGKTAFDPGFEFIKPHVELLQAGAHAPVNVAVRTDAGVSEGDDQWAYERKVRAILCEELDGELTTHGLAGQSKDDKEKRAALLKKHFGTFSRTAIESMESTRLRSCLDSLRAEISPETRTPEAQAADIFGPPPPTEAAPYVIAIDVDALAAKLVKAGVSDDALFKLMPGLPNEVTPAEFDRAQQELAALEDAMAKRKKGGA